MMNTANNGRGGAKTAELLAVFSVEMAVEIKMKALTIATDAPTNRMTAATLLGFIVVVVKMEVTREGPDPPPEFSEAPFSSSEHAHCAVRTQKDVGDSIAQGSDVFASGSQQNGRTTRLAKSRRFHKRC